MSSRRATSPRDLAELLDAVRGGKVLQTEGGLWFRRLDRAGAKRRCDAGMRALIEQGQVSIVDGRAVAAGEAS